MSTNRVTYDELYQLGFGHSKVHANPIMPEDVAYMDGWNDYRKAQQSLEKPEDVQFDVPAEWLESTDDEPVLCPCHGVPVYDMCPNNTGE